MWLSDLPPEFGLVQLIAVGSLRPYIQATRFLPTTRPRQETLTTARTQKSIFLFWLPLAATWIMMSVEGPFLAAVIARLADPRFNLAAHGVAFAFALLIEAPVIMIMSASTALVEDRLSFKRLRNFIYSLNGIVTGAQLLILIPPVFRFIMLDLVAVPEEVAGLTYWALWLLLPWPGAIGYRRFYHGFLIRDGQTRLVAVGTVIRLTAMASTGLAPLLLLPAAGSLVGAASLSVGVTGSRPWPAVLWPEESVRRLLETERSQEVTGESRGRGTNRRGADLRTDSPLLLPPGPDLHDRPGCPTHDDLLHGQGRGAGGVPGGVPGGDFPEFPFPIHGAVISGSRDRPHGEAARALPASGPIRNRVWGS